MGAEVGIRVTERGSDDERLEELSLLLRQKLPTLDVESVAEVRQQLVDGWLKKQSGTG